MLLEQIFTEEIPCKHKCGARLVTMTNEPVPRPSTTSVVVSQAKIFLFSTSWKFICQISPRLIQRANRVASTAGVSHFIKPINVTKSVCSSKATKRDVCNASSH